LVGIVTDSACSLPPELAAAHGVRVVPMWLTIGGRQYQDGEVGLEEVVSRLGEGVTTSGPAPGELARAVRGADDGDGVVVLTVSRRMSSVYGAARLAALQAEEEGKKVAVVDTRTAAGGQGLVVLAASMAAREGSDLDGVVRAAEAAAAGTRLLATLPSLAHLARSGRVPGAAAWGSRWLGLQPVFEFKEGGVRPLRPARGRGAALERVLGALYRDATRHEGARTAQGGAGLHVAALHALCPEDAGWLLAGASRRVAPKSAFVAAFSSVMVVHTGPGLAGLAWRWEPNAKG
jgi:DegV family protein with EDD domain